MGDLKNELIHEAVLSITDILASYGFYKEISEELYSAIEDSIGFAINTVVNNGYEKFED